MTYLKKVYTVYVQISFFTTTYKKLTFNFKLTQLPQVKVSTPLAVQLLPISLSPTGSRTATLPSLLEKYCVTLSHGIVLASAHKD